MRIPAVTIALLGSFLVPTVLQAQVTFTVNDREVQIHGYLSEGFASSTDNNYLRMDTSQGSFFTEAGLNVSSQVTDKFRVGAQVYDRYFGELGKGRVYLDWAFADYRWKDWMGFRGGKIKTSLGLYTDTQDQAFLHTWALLPQSVYPVDLRSVSVAHVGGDIYGNIGTKRGGVAFLHRLRRLDSHRPAGRLPLWHPGRGVETWRARTSRAGWRASTFAGDSPIPA